MALPVVGVKLVLEGAPGFLSQLGKVDAGIKNLGASAKVAGTAFDGVAPKWTAAAGQLASAADKASSGVAKVAPAANTAAGGIANLNDKAEHSTGVLGRLAGGLGTAAKAASGLALITGGAILAGLGGAAAAGLGFNNAMEQSRARINAFTKDAGKTEEILAMVTERAAKTPFAFEEMASAAAALGPAAKSSGMELEDLIAQAEILAASNPAEGLEGASFAIKEAISGDFTSAIERFNLSRSYINQLKAEGVPAMEALGMAMQQAGYDADLVTSLAGTMQGRWSTLKDTFTVLAGTVTQPIFDALSSGIGSVNDKLAGAMPMLTGVAEMLAGQVAGAVAYISGELTSFSENIFNADGSIKSFSDIAGIAIQVVVDQVARLLGIDLGGFALGWEGLGSEVMAILGTLGTNLLSWVGEQMPGWIASLQAMGQALVGFVTDATPGLLASLQAAGQRLLGWAQEQAPGWAASLGQLGAQLAGWVGENLPLMLGALGDARNALVSWVLDSLPGWASSLAQLGYQLYNWVLANLPQLGTALGTVAGVLLQKTGEFIGIVVPKLLELGGKLVVWVATEVLPKLPGELVKIGTALVNGLASFAIAIAPGVKKLQDDFTTWIQDEVIPKLPGELAKIGTAIVTGIGGFLASVGTEAGKIGKGIIDGISQAIKDGVGSIISAARNAAQEALDAAKAALGISSPSRAFYEQVGQPVGEGMALGILSQLGTVRDAAAKLGDEALTTLSGIAEQAQKLISDALSGRIGVTRGALSNLQRQGQDEADLQKAQDEMAAQRANAIKAEQEGAAEATRIAQEGAAKAAQIEQEGAEKAADIRNDAREKDEAAARKQADLATQLGLARYTAANNIDPKKREDAAARVLELERSIAEAQAARAADAGDASTKAADVEAQAQAKASEAQAAAQAKASEVRAAAQAKAETARSAQAKAERAALVATQIRDERVRLLRAATAQAAELAKTDSVAARDFYAARSAQIDELLNLRQEYGLAETDAQRGVLAQQLTLLADAQALETEQLQAGLLQRAADLANLAAQGKPTGNALIDGMIAGVRERQTALGAALIASVQAALSSAKADLGIRSPSLVFNQQVGQPIIGGIIAGIQAQMPALNTTMGSVATATVRPAMQNVSRSSTSITNNGHAISIDARGAQQGVAAEIRRAISEALSTRTGRAETIRRMS